MNRAVRVAARIAAASLIPVAAFRVVGYAQVAALPGQADLSATLADLTPDGWTLFDDTVLIFSAQNLYEQIDGRAEFYLAYDVVDMTFASYEKDDETGQFIDVSVYDMGTPTRAFGVFAGERTFEAPPLELGRESYRSGANYYVWKGQYYIQIIASDTTDALQRLGMGIGREVTRVLPDDGEAVWGLEALPQTDRVRGTEQFFLVDAMALDFMQNTYTAKYRKRSTLVTVFLSRRDDAESARAALDSYAAYADLYGDGVEALTVDGVQMLTCDMGDEHDVVFQKDVLLGGVTGVVDRDLAVQTAVELYSQVEVIR